MDKDGKNILAGYEKDENKVEIQDSVEKRVTEIEELKMESTLKYTKAKESIKSVISDIKETGGEFDHAQVEDTVNELLDFLTKNRGAFAFLTKEIFSYDDYLYNHSINVCTIGTAIMKRFNDNFSEIINNYLSSFPIDDITGDDNEISDSFTYFLPEEQNDISIGFFLHDIGKVLIPDEILNKKGALTQKEFEIVKTHSYHKGLEILDKNRMDNPFIRNITKYHHSPLFKNEFNCYPLEKTHLEVPAYVKVCKIADIYDAMTSKRCYKEALNPITVVTEVFRKYAKKDRLLQFILHSFVKAVGIYPPGSIAYLINGQICYILDSEGPIVIPFTDTRGNTLKTKPDPVNIHEGCKDLQIDRRKPLLTPIESHDILPSYLKAGVN